jgi:hypothetical protein
MGHRDERWRKAAGARRGERRAHYDRRRTTGRDLRRTRSRRAQQHSKRGAKTGRVGGLRAFLGPLARRAAAQVDAVLLEPCHRTGINCGRHRGWELGALAKSPWLLISGYAEILLGEPHDAVIKSNDPIRNPYPTVLEAIRERRRLASEKVATFAGWSVFNQITEHTEGATLVNAGIERLEVQDEQVRLFNMLQAEAATPWDGTRFDVFTFRLAMKHLASVRPRVLYLALDETDDWAHDGRYDRVLEALSRTDAYLKELWMWLQAQPEYRGRTHIVITTDHGRGHTRDDWRNHGANVNGSGDVWIALVSPRMPQRGPWRSHAPLSTSQIAATLASWMSVDWNALHPGAGRPIEAP